MSSPENIIFLILSEQILSEQTDGITSALPQPVTIRRGSTAAKQTVRQPSHPGHVCFYFHAFASEFLYFSIFLLYNGFYAEITGMGGAKRILSVLRRK
jgi:hypothetical protein